jgi:hypothetical protein
LAISGSPSFDGEYDLIWNENPPFEEGNWAYESEDLYIYIHCLGEGIPGLIIEIVDDVGWIYFGLDITGEDCCPAAGEYDMAEPEQLPAFTATLSVPE